MKLPPKTNENEPYRNSDTMSTLQALLSEKDSLIGEQNDIIEKKSDVIDSLKHRVQMLEEYLRLANSKRFDKSSEKSDSPQGDLFNEVEVTAAPQDDEPEQPPNDDKKAKT